MAAEGFAKQLLERVRDRVLPRIIHATIPFYAIQNDNIVRDRSGVLLRVADEYFILTASHDLQKIIKAKIYLYVGWDKDEQIPIPIHEACFHTTEDDCRDVAVIRLTTEVGHKLSETYSPISLHDIRPERDRTRGLFIVVGYPQAWLRVFPNRIESEPLPFISRLYEGSLRPTAEISYNPDIHALFEFTRDAIQGSEFMKMQLPEFKGIQGISGCGVWRICDLGASVEEVKPEKCRLVAIQHRYFEKEGYVHGTWIRFAIERLFAEYPHVASATTLIIPD